VATKKVTYNISGMTCGHCEKRIITAVRKLNGVMFATASFPKKQAEISIDSSKISESEIKKAIENEGYAVRESGGQKQSFAKVIPVFLIILAVYFIMKYAIGLDFFNLIPQIDSTISLAALFVTGIFTSVHCIAMCGGINLSQSVGKDDGEKSKIRKPLLYNLGRIVSYTAIGGIVGGLGSVLFISITVKGVIMLVAAVFMILMGLSMLGWLPSWLVPRMPKKILIDANKAKKGKGPFVVGLLNGLLPCGPLQAMQIYALSPGSVLMGAASMFLFSLGTVPLMLGAGFIFSMLKGRFTRGITRVSAILVILIAVVMFSNAGGLFGWNVNSLFEGTAQAKSLTAQSGGSAPQANSSTNAGFAVAQVKNGVQTVEATLGISGYPGIIVQKGIPVEYNLKADSQNINGCNATVDIPKFNIQQALKAGDNIMKFTPTDSGTITYTCWMGMQSGQIIVVDDLSKVTPQNIHSSVSAAGGASTGGCCAGSSQATKFAGGKIPVDQVEVAQIKNGEQDLAVTVNDQGYSPAVLVVQKGVKTKIVFIGESLSSCNSTVVFPEYNGQLNLAAGQTVTPVLTPTADFTFQCGMGMLHGYVKVVDDINNINLDQIKNEVSQYKAASGGGCCG
jgi:uncharacterized protein